MSPGHAGVALDVLAIQRAIPHREPFLFVDRILELVPGERIVGLKSVTAEEPFFRGHFPGHPIMPGVLIVEALAQTGAVLMLHGQEDDGIPLFAGIDRARFRRPVVPGDCLTLEVTVLQKRPGTCRMRGIARVDEDLAAQAEILAVIRPRAG